MHGDADRLKPAREDRSTVDLPEGASCSIRSTEISLLPASTASRYLRSSRFLWRGGRKETHRRMRALAAERPTRLPPGRPPGRRGRGLRARLSTRRPSRGLAEIDLAEAGRRYLANRAALGLKHTTLGDYESYLRVQLVPYFGTCPLDQIDAELVEAFMAAKRAEGKAPKSIVNYVGLLGSVFVLAVKRGWCSRNPVAELERPRVQPRPDIRFLSDDELDALLAAVPQDPLGGTERVLYLAAVMTGMRRGELLALRWQDVDSNSKLIRVRRSYTRGQFGSPKSRRSTRTVPLGTRLASELHTHRANSAHSTDEDLVFGHPTSGHVLDPSRTRKRFIAAARRARLRPIRFHDLRHTYATRLAAVGTPLRAIQEWMGHSDGRMTLVYSHYAPDLSQGEVWTARAFGE